MNRNVDAMKTEVTTMNATVGRLGQDINRHLQTLQTNVTDRLNQKITEVSTRLDAANTATASVPNDVRTIMNDAKTEFDQKTTAAAKIVSDAVNTAQANIASAANDVNTGLGDVLNGKFTAQDNKIDTNFRNQNTKLDNYQRVLTECHNAINALKTTNAQLKEDTTATVESAGSATEEKLKKVEKTQAEMQKDLKASKEAYDLMKILIVIVLALVSVVLLSNIFMYCTLRSYHNRPPPAFRNAGGPPMRRRRKQMRPAPNRGPNRGANRNRLPRGPNRV